MITSEAGVKARIKKELAARGWLWWMTPANGYGKAGLPDFFALKDGELLGIEAKFGKNEPTMMQREWLIKLDAAGCSCMVVNERNLDDFTAWLDAETPEA